MYKIVQIKTLHSLFGFEKQTSKPYDRFREKNQVSIWCSRRYFPNLSVHDFVVYIFGLYIVIVPKTQIMFKMWFILLSLSG